MPNYQWGKCCRAKTFRSCHYVVGPISQSMYSDVMIECRTKIISKLTLVCSAISLMLNLKSYQDMYVDNRDLMLTLSYNQLGYADFLYSSFTFYMFAVLTFYVFAVRAGSLHSFFTFYMNAIWTGWIFILLFHVLYVRCLDF